MSDEEIIVSQDDFEEEQLWRFFENYEHFQLKSESVDGEVYWETLNRLGVSPKDSVGKWKKATELYCEILAAYDAVEKTINDETVLKDLRNKINRVWLMCLNRKLRY